MLLSLYTYIRTYTYTESISRLLEFLPICIHLLLLLNACLLALMDMAMWIDTRTRRISTRDFDFDFDFARVGIL